MVIRNSEVSTRLGAPAIRLLSALAILATGVAVEQQGPLSAREADPSLWLVPPATTTAGKSPLATAIAALAEDRASEALPTLRAAAAHPVLGPYARLYSGRAYLATNQARRALEEAKAILATAPEGHVARSARLIAADAAEAMGEWGESAAFLDALADSSPANPEQILLRLGRAAREARQLSLAHSAFARVYYEYPLTPEAADAATELTRLSRSTPPEKVLLDLSRAHRLFGARRHADARKAYESLRDGAAADVKPLIDLRIAECDMYLKRLVAAREGLRPHVERSGPLQIEAQYFYLTTLREMGEIEEYLALVRAFVDAYPSSPLAEQTLNELGTYYIIADEDAKAAAAFTELYARFPLGTYADRAAWKAGWWAYKQGDYAETIRLFESAAVAMRRADYRPSWLYWAARSHAAMGHAEAASDGYQQVIAFYRNSYYGRQATQALAALARPQVQRTSARRPSGPHAADTVPAAPFTLSPGNSPDTAPVIQALLTAGLYDDAIGEIRDAQRRSGTSPLLEATLAFALNRRGELRPGVTAMRRAYPQFMAAGGETLPRELLTVIFPLDYWTLIRREAGRYDLDPFLMAALIAQESTFDPAIRSVANAWGLMQIIPDTGKRVARQLGIRSFSTSKLTDPETNVRIGMRYFSDLMAQFGDPAPALAAYNAGEHRVAAWLEERPGLPRDEFVDDIPFPETQNYVKRILGTAEDYRILYR
jgi:soluble lytic murein transglycosylase